MSLDILNGDNENATPSVVPYSAFGFKVVLSKLNGEQMGLFQEVSGLSMTIDKVMKGEGGMNHSKHILITGTSFSDITLKRGLFNRAFFDWISAVAKPRKEGEKIQRETLKIQLLGDDSKPVMTYQCSRALPIKWDGPSMNVMSDAIATETLVIAHEGLEVIEENKTA